jgi:hypothetical protein
VPLSPPVRRRAIQLWFRTPRCGDRMFRRRQVASRMATISEPSRRSCGRARRPCLSPAPGLRSLPSVIQQLFAIGVLGASPRANSAPGVNRLICFNVTCMPAPAHCRRALPSPPPASA